MKIFWSKHHEAGAGVNVVHRGNKHCDRGFITLHLGEAHLHRCKYFSLEEHIEEIFRSTAEVQEDPTYKPQKLHIWAIFNKNTLISWAADGLPVAQHYLLPLLLIECFSAQNTDNQIVNLWCLLCCNVIFLNTVEQNVNKPKFKIQFNLKLISLSVM